MAYTARATTARPDRPAAPCAQPLIVRSTVSAHPAVSAGHESRSRLFGDLPEWMTDPDPFLRALRLTEAEPSMLGCSAHVIGAAARLA
jgi:hypothetical protein